MFVGTVVANFIKDLPDLEDFSPTENALTSKIYASDGTLIATFHGEENRELVSLEQIPKNLKNAVIAIEDERFYKHKGFNPAEWPYVGNRTNWPPAAEPYGPDREYMVWDVVRYTEDIDQEQNDYPFDSKFCAFMKFYDSDLDWYEAAERYRKTVMLIDSNTPHSGGYDIYGFFILSF